MGGARDIWGTGEMHTRFSWEDLIERDHLEDMSVDGTIIIKWTFNKWNGGVSTGLIRLRTGTFAGCLRIR
jgi:hypothetical protein